MDSDDRRRLEAYIQSQNHFRGVSEEIAEEMLIAFIRRALPWLLDRIYDAVSAAWDYVRTRWGF